MRRAAACLLFVVLSAGGVVLALPGAAADGGAGVAPDAEAEFVARINELRRSKGVGELAPDSLLVGLARRWAASMAAAGAISHNPNLRSDVPEPWERVGENVGVGPDVVSLYDAFVASATHYRNLVDARFTRVGVGVVRTADGTLYTTHLFLQPLAAPAATRAARSRSPAPIVRPAMPTRAGAPPAIADAMAWSAVMLGPVASPVAGAAPVATSHHRSTPWLFAGVVAAALVALAMMLDRRRARHRTAAPSTRPRSLAVLDDYRATTPRALPTTTGLRWLPAAAPSSVNGDDTVGDGITARIAPYAVTHIAARWRLDELADERDDVVLVATLSGRVRYATTATERALGYAPGALAGLALAELVHPDDTPTLLDVENSLDGELRLRHGDGSWRHLDATVEDRADDPGVGGLVVRGVDVTERRAVEAEMRNRVERDPVTGLLARPTLLDRLGHAVQSLDDGEGVAVVVVHLAGLDVVHEAHGAAIVDCLVGAAADRLQHELDPAAIIGRYGDHDFAVVAPGAGSSAGAAAVAHRMLAAMRAPFVALAESVTLVASVGATLVEHPDLPAAHALQQAYVAMRAAERGGGDRIELFHPTLSGRAVSRLQDERALRRALEREELCLQYQPIVRSATGGMSGVEALMRWDHPERGLVSAAEFIAVAEDAGFIGELGWWALRTACIEAARWANLASSFRVSVNVSARQLAHPAFTDLVFGALAEADAPPSSLCLELTETSLLNDISESADRLRTVRDSGVTVAVDDFGTGYSSLGYLQQLPIDTVKIDRSFVSGIANSPGGDTIASAVVGLARGLGLSTVAEGVETEAQAGVLASLGCDHLQGYLCSPARPAPDIDGLFGTSFIAGVIDLRMATANGRGR